MKRAFALLLPLTLVPLVVSCNDSDGTPSNNVPEPTAGSGGSSAGSAGRAGAAGKPSPDAGAAGSSEGGAAGSEAGAAGEAGGGGDTPPVPFDGSCATLPGKIVYVESGDTQENLLKNLGRHLRDTANITLAFNLTGSCTLTADMYAGAKVAKSGMLKYVPSTAEDAAWTPSAAAPTCTTGAEGVSLDVAISALFVDSCGLGATPAGLALIQGPVQAYTFVVPTASEQTAIWAEEAYYAFGFGAQNPLAPTFDPWNDEAFLFIRPATKSTLVATAKNVALPANKWKGDQKQMSGEVVTAVSTSTKPKATIGILGSEVYDSNRSKGIQTLAFQATGQKAAYYPDSTSAKFDKQNVRDGHYTLWSPTVYIAPVDAQNVPTNPTVKYLIDLVVGESKPVPPSGAGDFDALADVVKVGLIPECAMKVTRATDGGPLSPFVPAESCTCYYLSKVPGAVGTPTGCTACASSAQCAAGSCNHGFCEPNAVDTAGAPGPNCFSGTPATHDQIINACTSAQAITKAVTLPVDHPKPLP